ncbi:MAG: glutathione peroxidase [Alphaproteobacteria bacterium]
MAKRLALILIAYVGMTGVAQAASGFDFNFISVDRKLMSLEQFRGKAVVVVNTATACGFSNQFEHLEKVWRDRKDEGLVIVGVSSNDFGSQEPRKGKALLNHCKRQYGVSFPLTERTAVVGPNAHPFYQWAAAQSGSRPKWNFHKYIVGRDGTIVASFPSTVDPRSAQMALAITSALKRPTRTVPVDGDGEEP